MDVQGITDALDAIVGGGHTCLAVGRLRLLIHGMIAAGGEDVADYVRFCAQKVREQDPNGDQSVDMMGIAIAGLL